MIIRRKLTENFTVMPNAVFRDERLSANAKGFMAYLLTCADHWEVHLTALGRAMGTGKDKTQAVIRELHDAGYVIRAQKKRPSTNQFDRLEYVVFDSLEARAKYLDDNGLQEVSRAIEPQPEHPAAGDYDNGQEPQRENPAAGFAGKCGGETMAAAVFSGAGKSGHIRNTNYKKPKGAENSAEAGAGAPSETSKVWKEGRELLKQSPSQANPSIIGKWLKRVPTAEGKVKLLAMFRAAVQAETADPIGYVTAALAKEFPPLPDYRKIDALAWERNQRAAIKTKSWSESWGPPPGKKGCAMPQHLITTELTAALGARKIAA